MKKIISDRNKYILKFKSKLEKELDIKIFNNENEILLKGLPQDEYIAERVIEAMNFGFSFQNAILIKKEDFNFGVINIKNYTHSNNLNRIKGRLIGKNGKVLKTLTDLTNCFFEIKGNEIGIIGNSENFENAEKSIIRIINGAKHSNIYKFLEQNKPKPIFDFGLKKMTRKTFK